MLIDVYSEKAKRLMRLAGGLPRGALHFPVSAIVLS